MASAKLDIRSLYIRNIYHPGRHHRSAIQEEILIPVRNLCWKNCENRQAHCAYLKTVDGMNNNVKSPTYAVNKHQFCLNSTCSKSGHQNKKLSGGSV